jgi:hypothetical protein
MVRLPLEISMMIAVAAPLTVGVSLRMDAVAFAAVECGLAN